MRYSYGRQSKYDATRLNDLFRSLRKRGLFARQSFWCCRNCAGTDLGDRLDKLIVAGKPVWKGCVFYTKQDRDDLKQDGTVYLAFGRVEHWKGKDIPSDVTPLTTLEVGEIVVDALREANMYFEWNGRAEQRILVDTNRFHHEEPITQTFVAEGI
jgi:hypothetical protein